jgi:hypothetical protein
MRIATQLASALAALPIVILTGLAGTAAAQTGAPVFSPSGDVVKLCDFEDGRVPPEMLFFVNNQYNGGKYTWSVDATRGANGTRKSLKFHVTSGSPYFYWDAHAVGGPRYLSLGKNVNRLSFFTKLPVGWGQHSNAYNNLEVGWYLTNDPSQNETDNAHYYTQVFLVPGSDWVHVLVGENYSWQRDQSKSSNGNGFDPRGNWQTAFGSFWGKLDRFYITGAPNTPGTELAPTRPYDMWFDEMALVHQDELIRASKTYARTSVGAKTYVTLYSTAKTSTTWSIKTTGLQSGMGAKVLNESGAAVTSLTINAGGSRQISVAPTAKGTANVVLYPAGAPQTPTFQNRSANTKYRGSYDQAGCAILVVGQ